MTKRVLLLMSDTGGGHRAAAEAISAALKQQHGDAVQTEMVDVFRTYAPAPYKYAPDFYPFLIARGKQSWGVGYNLSNSPRRAKAVVRSAGLPLERGIRQMLEEHTADVIVNVHPLFSQLVMQTLMTFDSRPPYVIVVTDLVSTHMFWYEKRAEKILVPTQPAFDRGVAGGVRANKMRVTGLPVHPNFTARLTDKATARRALGWDPDLPTVLMVGGGDGMGPLYNISRALNERRLNCQLVIVTGRNKQLKTRLEEQDWNQPTRVYPFVTNMPQLMAAADVFVTKAGPGSISEACIAGLPLVLYDAIPGQETGNVEYVVQNRAGVYTPDPTEAADTVARWLREGPTGLARRAEAARQLARPNAVFEITDEIWQAAQQPRIPTQRRNLGHLLNEFAKSFTP